MDDYTPIFKLHQAYEAGLLGATQRPLWLMCMRPQSDADGPIQEVSTGWEIEVERYFLLHHRNGRDNTRANFYRAVGWERPTR